MHSTEAGNSATRATSVGRPGGGSGRLPRQALVGGPGAITSPGGAIQRGWLALGPFGAQPRRPYPRDETHAGTMRAWVSSQVSYLGCMLTPEARFERDRDHFVDLLVKLLDRIDLAVERRQFHSLRPLFEEIEFLELAERCGLSAVPFSIVTVAKGRDQVSCYRWLDPHDVSIENLIPRGLADKCDDRSDGREEQDARSTLRDGVTLWFGTVHSLEVPAIFTPQAGPATAGRDPVLERDRLWRALRQAARALHTGGDQVRILWNGNDRLPQFMRKINALARYEGLSPDAIFERPAPGLSQACTVRVLTPAGNEDLVEFIPNASPGPKGCEAILHAVEQWMDARKGQLSGLGSPQQPAPRRRAGDKEGSEVPGDDMDNDVTMFDRLQEEGNSERFNKLPPARRKALAGFRLACESDQKLNRKAVTKAHHTWLHQHAPQELEGEAASKANTWMTYVRQGHADLFGKQTRRAPSLTRSMVTKDGAGHPPDSDE